MRKNKQVAIYPGSFDPITNGHLDILRRALTLFDEVIIAVGTNRDKNPLFSARERVAMIKQVTKGLPVQVESFSGLLVNYAKKKKVHHVIRGLRAVSDFEYEFQLATINRDLSQELDSVFFMTDKEYFYLSSSMVRQIVAAGKKVSQYVPAHIETKLKAKLK